MYEEVFKYKKFINSNLNIWKNIGLSEFEYMRLSYNIY
jgi:hypothetical protein